MIPEVPRGVLSHKKKVEKIDVLGWKIGRFGTGWPGRGGRRGSPGPFLDPGPGGIGLFGLPKRFGTIKKFRVFFGARTFRPPNTAFRKVSAYGFFYGAAENFLNRPSAQHGVKYLDGDNFFRKTRFWPAGKGTMSACCLLLAAAAAVEKGPPHGLIGMDHSRRKY
jgi:hypothetical protein